MRKRMLKILRFPNGFLWGSSVSSYQVEGNIQNCDWSKEFPAGEACQYYTKYEKYFDIAKKLNQNIHRFSLEWSRIQPSEGVFELNEIEHYKKVLFALRARNIKSMVTIWHWTLPEWFSNMGGWQNKKSCEYFMQYVKFTVPKLHELVDYWIILNEPEIYVSLAYYHGIIPPKNKSALKCAIVFKNLISAHNRTHEFIHSISNSAKTGSALNFAHVDSFSKKSVFNFLVSKLWDFFRNRLFLSGTKKKCDFVGVNYYFHDKVKIELGKFPLILKIKNDNRIVSDIGWEIYPQGIFHVLKSLKKLNIPIIITENGLADAADKKRSKFIKEHLKYVHKAISEGIPVKGYLYWSLIDNFEWTFGYKPRFGLVKMNFETLNAEIRPSAYEYAKICKNNYLETK